MRGARGVLQGSTRRAKVSPEPEKSGKKLKLVTRDDIGIWTNVFYAWVSKRSHEFAVDAADEAVRAFQDRVVRKKKRRGDDTKLGFE